MRVHRVSSLLAVGIVAAVALAACDDDTEPTSTPVTVPTVATVVPSPVPTVVTPPPATMPPAATPTTMPPAATPPQGTPSVAPTANRLGLGLGMLPEDAVVLTYLDVAYLTQNPNLQLLAVQALPLDPTQVQALGPAIQRLEAVAASNENPLAFVIIGQFDTAIVESQLSLGPNEARTYRDIRYFQIVDEPEEGAPGFFAPVDANLWFFAESEDVLKGMVDARFGGSNVLANEDTANIVEDVPQSYLVAIADKATLDSQNNPISAEFDVDRAAVSASAIDQQQSQILAIYVFASDSEAEAAFTRMDDPQEVRSLVDLPESVPISNFHSEREGSKVRVTFITTTAAFAQSLG